MCFKSEIISYQTTNLSWVIKSACADIKSDENNSEIFATIVLYFFHSLPKFFGWFIKIQQKICNGFSPLSLFKILKQTTQLF